MTTEPNITPNAPTHRTSKRNGHDKDSQQALSRRVVYSLFLASARVGFQFGIPIKEMGNLLDMAYYHETRQRGLKMREISKKLQISMRKVAMLSDQLKRNFLDAEQEHELPRRIEFMLWAEPLSEARIRQVLPREEPEEINDALALLLEQGRIAADEEREDIYHVVRSSYRLVSEDWVARLDGLNNLMASVGHAVYGRFFEDNPATFARTISLRVSKQDLPELRKLYEETIWNALVELEERAKSDPSAQPIDISIVWAPYDHIRKTDQNGDTQ